MIKKHGENYCIHPPQAKYIRPVFVFTKFYMESNTFVKMYFYKPFKSTKFIIS